MAEGGDATFTLKASPAPLAPLDVSIHVGESDLLRGDPTDTRDNIRWHLAESHAGLRTATVDTTGSTVFTVPTRTNGLGNTSTIRVALMDPSLLFADGEADYTPGRPSVAYVGVDAAAPEFPAQRSETQRSETQRSAQRSEVAEAPSTQVRNLRVTAVDATSAQATWDAVPHATAYRLSWEAGTGSNRIGGAQTSITGTSSTIYHNAPSAMTLTVRVVPWHVTDDGEVQMHNALAATATLDVGPADPLTAARTACVPADVRSAVKGYAGESHYGSAHVKRWNRALAAFGDDTGETAMTGDEAREMMDKYMAKRWRPIVEAIECIEKAGEKAQEEKAQEEKAQAESLPGISITGGGGVTEGSPASFTVTANPAPAAPLTVTLAVTQSGDFAASGQIGTREVVVLIGGNATFEVATVNDAVSETGGSVSAAVLAGTGYTVAASPGDTALVAVADNDTPVVRIAAGNDVTEGSPASFTVTADPPPYEDMTVTLAVTQSGDFAASGQIGTREVVVLIGGNATFEVATVNDAVSETGGSVSAAVLAGTGYTVAASPGDTALVAVADNDTPVVRIAAGNDVTEGSPASFTVTADPPPYEDMTVTLAVTQSGDFAASGQIGTREVVVPIGGNATFEVATVNDMADEPDGSVTTTISAGTGYAVAASPDDTASVTVADDDAALAVPGFTIGDVTANEDDRFMWFTVKLSMASNRPLQVSYQTRESNPISAQANRDFLQIDFGTLTFSPGETSKRFWVYVFNDSHDEGSETFEVVLSRPTGGAVITDGVAVGTIVNDDPLPAAWLSRFGRTVSQQVADALQDRLSSPAPLETGLQLTFAGEDFTSDTPLAENQGLLSKALGFENVSPQLLVQGSSFSFAPEGEGGAPQFALWGQGALSSFSGQEDDVSLDGDTTTLLVGADWSTGRWQAGAALSHSWGNGSYDGEDDADGEISTSLTGLFPYGRYALSPRLDLWATAGYGWGQLSLKPDGMEDEYKPDTTMAMVALGIDGLLLDGGSEGISLNTTADLLSLKTTSEEVEGLESSEGNVSRFRLGLEATRPFPLANGASLLPSMEVGIRQDSGDAETGFGMDLGAGMTWKDPERGISGELKGRTLLFHAEEDFQDQGLALSFSWKPSPSNRGPSLSMGHSMGLSTEEGIDALLNPTVLDRLDGLDASPSNGQQFKAELAYGFPAYNDRLTMIPAVATALSPTSRTYGLLWSVAPYSEQSHALPWEFSVEAERLEYFSSSTPADHSLKLNFSTLF